MGFRSLTTPISAVLCTGALVTAGCGGNGAGASPAATAAPPVLPASAIAYLPSHDHALTAADLLADGTQPGLAGDLTRWGFRGGTQRTFHGRSHRLQLVVSRTLVFGAPAGARAYVAYVKQHASGLVGASPLESTLHAGTRKGWLIVPAGCACHMAQPAVIGIVSGGPRVSYLELNGPEATPRALRSLFEQAP